MSTEEVSEKTDIKKNTTNKFNSYLKKAKEFLKKAIKKVKSVKINKNSLKYVIGIIVVILVIMFLGKTVFKGDNINYPILFNTSEGDLFLYNSSLKRKDAEATKLAVGESVSNILYANTTERYVLFKKGSDLYLYDSKKDEETIKIAENVNVFKFSSDDKYVIILDKEDSLSVYNYKTNTKIESDVSEIIDVSDKKVIFEKDNVIYTRSINPKKDDRERITAEYGSNIKFSEDGKNVIYINKENDLVVYNTSNNKDNKISGNVKKYYCDKESCNKLFYIENSDVKKIYYYNGKKATKVAEGIYDILDVDVNEKQVVYSTTDSGTYTIHYQEVDKEAVKVEEKLPSVRVLRIYEGKEIYYITGKNEVKYAKISGNKVNKPRSLGTEVIGYLNLYKDGFAFVTEVDSNGNGTLYLAKNGKAKKIDNNVNSTFIKVNKTGNKIYYFKDYEVVGTLYVTSGSKNKKIDENVYNFTYINDDLIYYIKDYSNTKSRGDLFIYKKGKNHRIYEGVSRIAGSPVKSYR